MSTPTFKIENGFITATMPNTMLCQYEISTGILTFITPKTATSEGNSFNLGALFNEEDLLAGAMLST